jgi:hypothetical protein
MISMFYFGEKIPFCEIKKVGKVKIVNKSTNPYDLFLQDELIETLNGKTEYIVTLPIGISTIKAIQKSGFMLYPTQNNRVVTIKNPCENSTVEIGFEDQ